MGLNRYFSIQAEFKDGSPIEDIDLADRIKSRFDEIYGYWEGQLADDDCITLDGVSWYSFDEDMSQIANEFPDILFTGHCEGECIDDIWDFGICGNRTDFQTATIPPLRMDYLRGNANE